MTTLTEDNLEQTALDWRLCLSDGGWRTLRTLQREALLPRPISGETAVPSD